MSEFGKTYACITQSPRTTHLMREEGQPRTEFSPRSLCGRIKVWNHYPISQSRGPKCKICLRLAKRK